MSVPSDALVAVAPYGIQSDVRASMGFSYAKK